MPWLSETQKIGVGLTGFGLFFMLIGMVLLDNGLLAIGNLLFLGGVVFVIGPSKTLSFFFQPKKLRGTICFIIGILLVLFKWVFIGILVEMFGFVNLFGDFFPVVVGFLRKLPVIGTLLNLPFVSVLVDKLSGAKLPV